MTVDWAHVCFLFFFKKISILFIHYRIYYDRLIYDAVARYDRRHQVNENQLGSNDVMRCLGSGMFFYYLFFNVNISIAVGPHRGLSAAPEVMRKLLEQFANVEHTRHQKAQTTVKPSFEPDFVFTAHLPPLFHK